MNFVIFGIVVIVFEFVEVCCCIYVYFEFVFEEMFISDFVVELFIGWGYDVYCGIGKIGVVGVLCVG